MNLFKMLHICTYKNNKYNVLSTLILQYNILLDSFHFTMQEHLLDFLAEAFDVMYIIFNA